MAYQGHGTIHQRNLLPKKAYKNCTQEEARLEAREEKLGNEENQALTVHARKGKNKVEDRPPRKFQKYQKKKQRNNSTI